MFLLALDLVAAIAVLLILLAIAVYFSSRKGRRRFGQRTYPYRARYARYRGAPWDRSSTLAEYSGRCPRCGRRIEVGDPITWWNPDGEGTRWVHVDCLAGG
jgi:hypothetical protein